ncbi:MAG: 50S ribosomal protein L23 [Candidatus Tectomicrobia bacterium]|nr:50S ribosomal protein L23 [Candidatus Tectomicrobia bacterium]
MIRDHYMIIKRPIVTEKSTILNDEQNKVSFEVDMKANKREIKKAVEKLFGVAVIQVNTVKMKGKSVKRGKIKGRTSDWKKAIVTLKEGNKIDFFGGV